MQYVKHEYTLEEELDDPTLAKENIHFKEIEQLTKSCSLLGCELISAGEVFPRAYPTGY